MSANHDEDVHGEVSPPTKSNVRIVEDAAACVRRLPKNHDAEWVAGLRPEDEEEEILRLRLRQRQAAAAAAEAEAQAHRPSPAGRSRRHGAPWLLLECCIGFLWIALLALRLASGRPQLLRLHEVEFPPYEFRAWTILREAHDPDDVLSLWLTVWCPVVLPSIAAGVFALVLTFRFAKATQSFACHCAFGVAALSLLATIATGVIVALGCSGGDPRDECNVPVVSSWVASIIRWCAPWLCMWPVVGTLDGLRGQLQLRGLCALPLVGLMAVVAAAWWACVRTDGTLCGDAQPLTALDASARHYGLVAACLYVAEVAALIAALLLVVRLWTQRPIGLVPLPTTPLLEAPPEKTKRD